MGRITKYLASFLTASLMLIPIIYIIISAFQVDQSIWTQLWHGRLPLLLRSSLLLTAAVTLGAVLLGSSLALIIERTDLPGRTWFRPLLTAPLIIPCYIIGICYTSFFGVRGLCEKLFNSIGQDVTVPNIYGLSGATAILILGTYPYVYTIVGTAIRSFDPRLSEVAQCLGSSRRERFTRITLPLLIPALSAGAVLSALYTLSDFGVVNLLRYPTFVNAIYEQMSGRYNYAVPSALSLSLVLLTLFFLLLQEKIAGQKKFTTVKNSRTPNVVYPLGWLKIPLFLFVVLIITFALILPIGILVFWFNQSMSIPDTISHWKVSTESLIRSGINSLTVSGITATAAIMLALPLTYLSVRGSHNPLGKILSGVSQSGIALPGILIALGLLLVFNRIAPHLSFSIFSLCIAFLVHFFAQALQATRSGLLNVSEKIEEEARVLGCTPFQTFWHVTRPLLKSALLSGWVLVFLSSMRELPASLMLRPAGFDPLTVKVWIAASEGFYEQAAGGALLLVLFSLPLVLIILRGGNQQSFSN